MVVVAGSDASRRRTAARAEARGSSAGDVPDDVQAVARLHKANDVIRSELSKVIVGQEEVIDLLLITCPGWARR